MHGLKANKSPPSYRAYLTALERMRLAQATAGQEGVFVFFVTFGLSLSGQALNDALRQADDLTRLRRAEGGLHHAHEAKDIMSRFVVSVSPQASLAEVADILDSHRIRQVPVMEGGKLLGMISRADLVRKLAEVTVSKPAARSDNGALQKATEALGTAEGTVKNHASSILSKLGVRDRTRAVLKALELGYI